MSNEQNNKIKNNLSKKKRMSKKNRRYSKFIIDVNDLDTLKNVEVKYPCIVLIYSNYCYHCVNFLKRNNLNNCNCYVYKICVDESSNSKQNNLENLLLSKFNINYQHYVPHLSLCFNKHNVQELDTNKNIVEFLQNINLSI